MQFRHIQLRVKNTPLDKLMKLMQRIKKKIPPQAQHKIIKNVDAISQRQVVGIRPRIMIITVTRILDNIKCLTSFIQENACQYSISSAFQMNIQERPGILIRHKKLKIFLENKMCVQSMFKILRSTLYSFLERNEYPRKFHLENLKQKTLQKQQGW